MSFSSHFELLGAPLNNTRWSWGAARPDGTLLLRVWQDQTRRQDGSIFIRLTNHSRSEARGNPHGDQERLAHVEMLRQGARCYLVICVAKDEKAIPRDIKEFDEDRLFPGGKLVELDGDWWIELRPPVPVRSVLPTQSA